MSPAIVFIVLNSAVKEKIICDLAEKCYSGNKKLVILSQNTEQARHIDKLLWTWKQQSFIPHRYIEALGEPQTESVIITTRIDSNPDYDILLTVESADFDIMSQFGMVIEFAEKYDAHALQDSRNRYRIYKEKGLAISSMQPGEFLHSTLI